MSWYASHRGENPIWGASQSSISTGIGSSRVVVVVEGIDELVVPMGTVSVVVAVPLTPLQATTARARSVARIRIWSLSATDAGYRRE